MQDKELFGSLLTDVDSTATTSVGTIRSDEFGNKYIYLQGIASVALGSIVTYKQTTRAAATMVLATTGSKGHIAVAMAAVVASKFGWFQIEGWSEEVLAISGGDAAVGGRAFLTGTAGQIDDVVAEGDEIIGMVFTVQEGETTLGAGYAGVYMNAPRTLSNAATPILTQVDASALYAVGARHTDEDGNEYIYLKGVASTAAGSAVSFAPTTTALSATALLITNAVGFVGVAMAAVIANKFGWFQVRGLHLSTQCDSSAAVGQAYIGGTTGGVDHTAVAGDIVHGMIITVADAANICGVFMENPHCNNLAIV